MSRPNTLPDPVTWPPEPDAAKFPRYGDRPFLARIHQHYFGPISEYSLPTWPLDWIIINGRAVADTSAFLTEAKRRFDIAPRIQQRIRSVKP